MRNLTMQEMGLVAGGGDQCTAEDGNNFGGVTEPNDVGSDLIAIYEGVVAAASHIIERVANAL